MPVKIERYAPDSPDAQHLIALLDAELRVLYPEEGATFFDLSVDETADGHGAFLLAYQDTRAVGCAALRKITRHTAEIKRMYVTRAARKLGVARQLLAALDREGRALGVTSLVLETGARQEDAMLLYRREGFVEIPRFGPYVSSPLSICMERRILDHTEGVT